MTQRFRLSAVALAVVAACTLAAAQNRPSADTGNRSKKAERSQVAEKNALPVKASDSTRRKANRPRRKRNPTALTPSRKAAALEFARRHHPELAELLSGLEKRNKNAYRRAMRQLYTTSERLARAKERLSAERFELELDAWKLDSRIRLLAARVAVSPKKDEKLERELQRALLERIDIQVRRLQRDKARLVRRLEKLDANIAGIEADREKAAERYLKRIHRGLGIKNRKNRGKRRPANGKRPNRKREKPARSKRFGSRSTDSE